MDNTINAVKQKRVWNLRKSLEEKLKDKRYRLKVLSTELEMLKVAVDKYIGDPFLEQRSVRTANGTCSRPWSLIDDLCDAVFTLQEEVESLELELQLLPSETIH